MATKEQEELAAYMIAAGITAHAASDIISRGRLTKAETGLLLKVFRKVAPPVGRVLASEAAGLGRLAVRGVRAAAITNPYTLAAILVYEGYIHRDEIGEVAAQIAQATPGARELAGRIGVSAAPRGPLAEQIGERVVQAGTLGAYIPRGSVSTRRISRANTAVKQGMTWLKAGTKATSGAKPGILPKGAFRIAVKAAGMANPNTKSKPGKGKSIMNKLARRLRKWW